ncbi:sodium/potassium/calcium exchanger 5-like [Glandiceps talaboti]
MAEEQAIPKGCVHAGPTTERCSDCSSTALDLSYDVAGATFMTIGASAPEMFTTLICILIADSNVSIGAIMGSAAFNILFSIGVLGIYFGKSSTLSLWPMLRDLFGIIISVLALIFVIKDERVYWYEATILIFLYGFYIFVMYFNKRLSNFIESQFEKVCQNSETDKEETVQILKEEVNDTRPNDSSSVVANDENIESDVLNEEDEVTEDTETCSSSFRPPSGYLKMIYWIITLPIKIAYFVTIPDCKRPRWRRWYMLTAFMSAVWFGFIAYVLVWMISVTGYTIGIPRFVMAIVFLGAGNSVPDLVASFLVAREGHWDMAVANCLGSNIFEVLLCLAVPWIIKILVISNAFVPFSSEGMILIPCLVILTVLAIEIVIMCNGRTINRIIGVLSIVMYIVIIIVALLYGLTVAQNKG